MKQETRNLKLDHILIAVGLLVITAAEAVFASETVAVTVAHPEREYPPESLGCSDIRSLNLESSPRKPRPPVMVPEGCDTVLSKNCPVSSSDDSLRKEDLQLITDGVKSYATNVFVALKDGPQWVQIDLLEEKEIYAICIWHYLRRINIYHDVICQLSNDKAFAQEVTTIFNNDHNNSSKLGAGPDKEYIEDHTGRILPAEGKRARYVRFYSNGSAARYNNDYIEVEVFGRFPSEREVIVNEGDSLSKIAKAHGVSVEALTQANNLENPNLIKIGQKLKLPQAKP
jgi:hypothetical protein